MDDSLSDPRVARAQALTVPPDPAAAVAAALTEAGRAPLAEAASLASNASAPASLRAYRSDWAHYAAWCAAMGKMHRFNDLPWNPAHRGILGPLDGLLRAQGRPVAKAAPLTLVLLRQLLATCDVSARGWRDRALLLLGFAGALRRSELVALRVEDVVEVAGGLKLRILRGKTDQAWQEAEIGLPRGRQVETCPVRAFHAWQAVAKRKAGPLFRRISTGDRIGDAALRPDALSGVLAHRIGLAGVTVAGFETLSAHLHRGGFITEAYGKGVRDEDIIRHTRHRDFRTMRGYVQRPASSPKAQPEPSTSDGIPDALGADAGSGPAAPSSPIARETARSPSGHHPDSIVAAASPWLYHHLTISGPGDAVTTFADAARGAGTVPWRLEAARLEEDVFNLAASQPKPIRSLTIAGCRILARQFRERVEDRAARAAARVGRGRACPFDLHALLPVPGAILELGPSHLELAKPGAFALAQGETVAPVHVGWPTVQLAT